MFLFFYFHFIKISVAPHSIISSNSKKVVRKLPLIIFTNLEYREREMRFRAAFRVCESRNRAPLLLQPQASRSFSQLPLNPQRFVSLLYSLFMLCELSFWLSLYFLRNCKDTVILNLDSNFFNLIIA